MFKISDLARADITEIWLYISKDDINSANEILDELERKFILLSYNPKLGKLRINASYQARSFPCKNYLIIYNLHDRNIEIIRILHQSRDLERLL